LAAKFAQPALDERCDGGAGQLSFRVVFAFLGLHLVGGSNAREHRFAGSAFGGVQKTH
jgi:hypothetical protein